METCRICLEEISPEDLYTTKCGHKFHKDCFEGLENINKKTILRCPLCNEILKRPSLDSQLINEEIDMYIADWGELNCEDLIEQLKLTYGKIFEINEDKIHAECEKRNQHGGNKRRRKNTKRYRKNTKRYRKNTKRYRKNSKRRRNI